MPRVIFLFLVLAGCSQAATLPSGVSPAGGRSCASFINAVSVASGTVQCNMSNVVAGDTLILTGNLVTATTFTVSGTETFTCPSQLLVTKSVSGFVHDAFICYLVLASNHADFNVTVTVTSGIGNHQGVIKVFEFAGLGAVDTGSRVAANAFSTSVTTANASEMMFVFGEDLSNAVTPSGSNNYYDMLISVDDGGLDYRQLYMIQKTAGAGSYTASYTSTGSNVAAVNFVLAVAFQVSGGSPQGSIYSDQFYHFLFADAGSNTKPMYLYNVTTGTKGVIAYHLQDNGAALCAVDSGESCFCPAGAFVTTLVGGLNYAQGLCYVDFTGNHSGYVTFTMSPFTSTASFDYLEADLMIGLPSGTDSGSPASAIAQTVNYTTAFANEQTVCLSSDISTSYPLGLMTPGNSFKPTTNGYSDAHNGKYTQGLDMQKLTVSSGSNTCSSSIGASTVPLISVLAFGPATAVSPRHSQIM